MKSCLKSVASRFNRKCHKNGLQAVSKCFNRRGNDSFLGKTFDETVYALETHEKRHKSVGMNHQTVSFATLMFIHRKTTMEILNKDLDTVLSII